LVTAYVIFAVVAVVLGIDNLQTKVKDSHQENVRLCGEIKALKETGGQNSNTMTQSVVELQNEVRQVQNELERSNVLNRKLRSDVESLQKTDQQRTTDLLEVKNEVSDLRDEAERLQAEIVQ
jgi:uncharacterized coiled-coil DUF342 family protein